MSGNDVLPESQAWFEEGVAHCAVGAWKEAQEAFANALALDPFHHEAQSHLEWARQRHAGGNALKPGERPPATPPRPAFVPAPAPVAPAPTKISQDRRLQHLLDLGNFEDAYDVVEQQLEENPEDPRLLKILKQCSQTLENSYLSKLGGWDHVCKLQRPLVELMYLNLSQEEGYVLSRVDGRLSVRELVEVAGMPRVRVLKTLLKLLRDGTLQVSQRA